MLHDVRCAFVDEPNAKELRAAAVANVLACAVREGDVDAIDAGRILRHELRRLNVSRSLKVLIRSAGAQASVDKHAPDRPPRNGSDDALHADHVHPFTTDLLYDVKTLDEWVRELRRLSLVVCVTAKENYVLEQLERAGHCGPTKYAAAGVTFVTAVPW